MVLGWMCSSPVWRVAKVLSICAVLLGGTAGCFKSGGDAQARRIPPGTMKVISVEPIDREAVMAASGNNASAQVNLLPCGDFSSWWTGAPAPNGLLPPDGSRSLISRTPEGAVRQEWTRPEDSGKLKQRFRCQAVNLQAGTYHLEIVAESIQRGGCMVTLWREEGETYTMLPVEPILLVPGTSAAKRYGRTFTLGAPAKIVVASEIPAGAMPQTAVHWIRWTLKPAG